MKFVMKAEGDVGGGLNDGLNELRDVIIFEVDGDAVNVEARQIVEAQMRNGADEIVHIVKLVRECFMLVQ